MKRFLLSVLSTLALLSLNGQRGQASQIPSWGYNFAVTPNSISGTPSGSGAIQFSGYSNVHVAGSNDVFLADFRIVRPNETTSPIFSGIRWTGSLTLSDAYGVSKALAFKSIVNGTFASTAGWLNLDIKPLQPLSTTLPSGWSRATDPNGQKEYVWKSPGGNLYTVDPYVVILGLDYPPGPKGDNIGFGGVNADVQVNNNVNNTTGTPEPSTLVLSCFALGIAGLASRCQWRRVLATQLG